MSRSEYSGRPGGQLTDLPVSRLSNRIRYWLPAAMDEVRARLGACGYLVTEGS